MTRYRRVVVKLSGGALAGDDPIGLDSRALEHVAGEVLALAGLGVQTALVVGGGNFFRGTLAEEGGYDEAIARDLRVMDPSAFILARDRGLPLHVFDVARSGAMAAIARGEDVGTAIAADAGVSEPRART